MYCSCTYVRRCGSGGFVSQSVYYSGTELVVVKLNSTVHFDRNKMVVHVIQSIARRGATAVARNQQCRQMGGGHAPAPEWTGIDKVVRGYFPEDHQRKWGFKNDVRPSIRPSTQSSDHGIHTFILLLITHALTLILSLSFFVCRYTTLLRYILYNLKKKLLVPFWVDMVLPLLWLCWNPNFPDRARNLHQLLQPQ